jgi:hypothetical protein
MFKKSIIYCQKMSQTGELEIEKGDATYYIRHPSHDRGNNPEQALEKKHFP